MSYEKQNFVEDSPFNDFNDMIGNYIPYNSQDVTMIENVDIEWFESDYYNGSDFDLTTRQSMFYYNESSSMVS